MHFVLDFEKTFESVHREILWNIMRLSDTRQDGERDSGHIRGL